MVWLIGLRDPASLASYRRFHPAFPGGCVWARWAGCPRRLLTKKLTKSYTRSPVVGAACYVANSMHTLASSMHNILHPPVHAALRELVPEHVVAAKSGAAQNTYCTVWIIVLSTRVL